MQRSDASFPCAARAVSRLPEDELQAALGRLVASELVFQRGTPPDAVYRFKHALVQDAATAACCAARASNCTRRSPKRWKPDHRTSGQSARLFAQHYAVAGEAEKAARHWLKAGQHALRRSANTEAIAHLTNGIGALTGLSEHPHAWSELKLLLALGPTLWATHGWSSPEAERAYRRAEQLAQGLGADRERFDALWGLWMINNTGGAPDVARGITSELFQIADQLDDATLRMEAHHACWASANTQGEHAATIEHVRQGLAIYDSDKHGAQAFSYGMSLHRRVRQGNRR